MFTFTSYPFLFSIERGNYDIIALLFTLVSIDLLIRTQKTLWLQVILLSIAIHLKIYPAALLILLFFKHGKKIFLPVLVVNGAFLFILGPQNAITFLQIVMNSIEKGFPLGLQPFWSLFCNLLDLDLPIYFWEHCHSS